MHVWFLLCDEMISNVGRGWDAFIRTYWQTEVYRTLNLLVLRLSLLAFLLPSTDSGKISSMYCL